MFSNGSYFRKQIQDLYMVHLNSMFNYINITYLVLYDLVVKAVC